MSEAHKEHATLMCFGDEILLMVGGETAMVDGSCGDENPREHGGSGVGKAREENSETNT